MVPVQLHRRDEGCPATPVTFKWRVTHVSQDVVQKDLLIPRWSVSAAERALSRSTDFEPRRLKLLDGKVVNVFAFAPAC